MSSSRRLSSPHRNTRKICCCRPVPVTRRRSNPGQPAEWILGFHHDRAAQIAALTWADPLDTNPAARFESIDLAVSVDSPAGPWEPIGTWTLDRNNPESLVFELTEPRWARFVRFTAAAPSAPPDSPTPDQIEVEFPAQLRVFERPPVDDYLTILGEWGHASTAAGYELQHPSQPGPLDDDAGDRHRRCHRALPW